MEQSTTEATADHGLPEDVADAWAAVVLDILEKDGDTVAAAPVIPSEPGEQSCQPAI